MAFPRATEIAHFLLKSRIRPGDHVVDATVGNGHDTLFLAECVGAQGRVDGFDIQIDAIEKAQMRVAGNPAVFLHHLGHEEMRQIVAPGVTSVVFNLGYFPGGNKNIITRTSTTLPALSAARDLIAVNGLITLVVYPGHPGGDEEAQAVEEWTQSLDSNLFHTIHYGRVPVNPISPAPYLIAIERTG